MEQGFKFSFSVHNLVVWHDAQHDKNGTKFLDFQGDVDQTDLAANFQHDEREDLLLIRMSCTYFRLLKKLKSFAVYKNLMILSLFSTQVVLLKSYILSFFSSKRLNSFDHKMDQIYNRAFLSSFCVQMYADILYKLQDKFFLLKHDNRFCCNIYRELYLLFYKIHKAYAPYIPQNLIKQMILHHRGLLICHSS